MVKRKRTARQCANRKCHIWHIENGLFCEACRHAFICGVGFAAILGAVLLIWQGWR